MDCCQSRFADVIAVVFSPALKIALACTFAVSGCSTGSDSLSKPAARAPVETKSTPTKPPRAAVPSHGIEELIAREERGQTILQVKFSQPINEYRHFTLPQPSRIVLDVLDKTEGSAIDETFRVDTRWVSALRINMSENNLRLVTEIAAATVPAYTIMPENGGVQIIVGTPDLKATAKKSTILVQAGRRIGARQLPSVPADARSQLTATEDLSPPVKTYKGQKISLDFKDADIKNVFRLLAEVSDLNIVVTSDVNRRVTLRLIEVPWDQAMDLIIDTNGLAKEEIGNVVRISTAGTIRGEKEALLAARRAQDSVEELETAYFTVNYARANDLVEKVISKIKPNLSPRGVVVPDERSNTIVVRDIRKGVEDAVNIMSRLDVRTPQVLIESNLIETTPSFSRALGFELAFTKGVDVNSNFPAGEPFSPLAGATISVIQDKLGPFRNVNATLTAAEQQGHVRIISQPSVLTLNNEESTIKSTRILRVLLPAGGSTTAVGGGVAPQQAAVQDIEVGITLKVTPQVSDDGFVLMKIDVKSSTLGARSSGAAIPDELNRNAIANVLVKDGETIVIGGIIKDEARNSEGGIPYLKEIPVLGWLFKSTSYQKNFEELMVFITPRITTAGAKNLPESEQLWRDQLRQTQGTMQPAPVPNP